MNKILYVHSSNELYGADRSLLRTATGINPKLYQPSVILPNDIKYEGLLSNELTKSGIPVQEMKLGVLRRQYFSPVGVFEILVDTIKSTVSLTKTLKSGGFSLVHTNTTAVMSGGIAARFARIPHIWHVREIIQNPAWLNFFIAYSLNKFATQVIAVSKPVKENLIRVQPALAQKTRVVHNGIDPTLFTQVDAEDVKNLRRSWKVEPDGVVVGMVGRISSWKGQDLFLRAASMLIKDHPDLRFVLVGGDVPGESRQGELVRLIQDLGLQDHVQLEKFRFDISTVLSSFDIFVLPSTKPDPFPTVVLEAMAAGRPVIATCHGGAVEQVEDQVTGLLVSPNHPGEMANAIKHLIESPLLRIDMGEKARTRLLSQFTFNQYIHKLEEIYKTLIGEEGKN